MFCNKYEPKEVWTQTKATKVKLFLYDVSRIKTTSLDSSKDIVLGSWPAQSNKGKGGTISTVFYVLVK